MTEQSVTDSVPICPICDEVDSDGLEACSSCYNDAICEAKKMRELHGIAVEMAGSLQSTICQMEGKLIKMKEQRDTANTTIKALNRLVFSLKRELEKLRRER